MAKLLKLRRGTTTQHSSFTGAEGEVTVDTDKETLVVHDGSTAGGHPVAAEDLANVSSSTIAGRLSNDSIAPSKIGAGALPTDVTVTNANVVANAAIAGTKVSPDFGSQNISTTGNISTSGNASVSGTNLNMSTAYIDFSGSLSSAPTTAAAIYRPADNSLAVSTGNNRRLLINNTGATLTGALDVTGNISLSGTVDGRDVASDGSKLDGIESGATGDQTKADIDALNINADTVDSLHASSFVRSDANDVLTGSYDFQHTGNYPVVIGNSSGMADAKMVLRGSANPYIRFREQNTDKAYIQWNSGGYIEIYNEEHARSLKIKNGESGLVWNVGGTDRTVWHSGNDGSSSGLDADKWDGYQFSDYINQAIKSNSNVTFNTIHLDGTINSSSAGALFGRNHAYDTTELRGHGAEFMIGSKSVDIHINYRTCNNGATNNTPTTWYWRAGASNNWSSHNFGNVTANGSITATGNVTAYSDARLKTNVNTINEALGIVGKLRGVSFDWKESGKHSIGVIAQEVEEVLPELVETIQENIGTKEEPEYREVKTVDYGKIVGVLINAINELKAEVDELKGGK